MGWIRTRLVNRPIVWLLAALAIYVALTVAMPLAILAKFILAAYVGATIAVIITYFRTAMRALFMARPTQVELTILGSFLFQVGLLAAVAWGWVTTHYGVSNRLPDSAVTGALATLLIAGAAFKVLSVGLEVTPTDTRIHAPSLWLLVISISMGIVIAGYTVIALTFGLLVQPPQGFLN